MNGDKESKIQQKYQEVLSVLCVNAKHRNPLSAKKDAVHPALMKLLVPDVPGRSVREMMRGLACEFPFFSSGRTWSQYLELGQDVRMPKHDCLDLGDAVWKQAVCMLCVLVQAAPIHTTDSMLSRD